jgi:hypothetical protein
VEERTALEAARRLVSVWEGWLFFSSYLDGEAAVRRLVSVWFFFWEDWLFFVLKIKIKLYP